LTDTYPNAREDQAVRCPHCADVWLRTKNAGKIDNRVLVEVICETCEQTSFVQLRGHKGQLFLSWESGRPIKTEAM
jgi:hypothetical protein